MISVASYCRVSTDKEDQTNSFAAQQRYFSQYIRQHPQWELYRIYADEGITGTRLWRVLRAQNARRSFGCKTMQKTARPLSGALRASGELPRAHA